jgi:hypothetical protein
MSLPRGRPRDLEPARQHQMRLPDRVVAALERIARREGLLYGGLPSVARAVRWLVEQDPDGFRD